ncbi:sulfotransferase 1C4-like [Scyliorhinus canicula]|uniref:sulfotransferase 1C4-like n=1 Tax=Scyliorhinus canicula TaxID=7830 RepID=UPI0018F40D8A|nr:sulfotransferase 1C4-like [Scyliorhinus canicula]
MLYPIDIAEKIFYPILAVVGIPEMLVVFGRKQLAALVYIARNPKNNVVSYYHFHRICNTMVEPGSWEEFLVSFMEGNVSWGWYDHVKGFWKLKDEHQILYLFYEDLKECLKSEIAKVVMFLGKDLSDEKIETIVENTGFQVMKENPMAINISCGWRLEKPVHSGPERGFDDDCRRKMEDTSLRFRTDI